MHLQKLKVKNLASLRGEHTIDFEELGSQDLFAITGETGAGKSTLLNAISLALYGKVYKRNLIQSDLVTLGERDAAIELSFSVKGTPYLAKWSTTVRKKNGELLSAPRQDRFLYNVQGEPQVLDKNAETLLSLDFDQFSKCVVLNQGEFARFLTSTFAERRDILEHLYPSDNLEAVGGLARKKFETVQEKLQRLDVQVHSLNEETLFDVKAAEAAQLKFHNQVESAQTKLKELRPWAQGLLELKSYSIKHREAREKLAHAEETLKARTLDNNNAMTAWRDQQTALESFEAKFNKERPELEANDQLARKLSNDEVKLKEDQKLLKHKSDSLGLLLSRLKNLRHDLAELHNQQHALESKRQFKAAQDLTSIAWSDWEKSERQIPLFEHEVKSLSHALEQLTAQGKTHSQEEKELREQYSARKQQLPADWQNLNKTERATQLTAARELSSKVKLEAQEKIKLLASQIELKKQLDELQPKLKLLTLEAENEALKSALKSLEQHLRSHALPGQCPVCEAAVSEAKWQTLLAKLAKTSTSSTTELQTLQKTADRLITQLDSAAERLQALNSHSPINETALKELEAHHDELSSLELKLTDLEKRLQTSRVQWKEAHDKLKLSQEKLQGQLKSREDILKTASEVLGTTLTWTPTLLTELTQERELVRQLTDKKLQATQLGAQEKQQSQDEAKLTDEIKTLTAASGQLTQTISAERAKLEALYPGTTPQELLKQKNEEWRTRSSKVQLLQQEFRQKEMHLAEARSSLGRIQEQLQQLELLFAELTARMQSFRPIQVQILEAEAVLTPLTEGIQQEIEQEEALSEQAASERDKLKTLLVEDQKRREKKALFEKQQDEARKESHRWKRLLDVLGTDDMRTYVLSLVETALIRQTNVELEKLCAGRYEIQHNSKKGKLTPEFWVIDHFKDGLLRKVTTLSGGETFMVSLAMALALAEMARGRADIDCFFIDEGFGTLDENSLEDVMEMLQQVRSRGKQIGLITHVKALSQRLPLNLKVTKDSRGNSHTSVVWN